MFWIYFDSPLADSRLQKISDLLTQREINNTLEDCVGDILVNSEHDHSSIERIIGSVIVDSGDFTDFELAES